MSQARDIADNATVTTISGNAGTATALQNARTIGGVSFDGSANINLPGVNSAGNQDTSGNADTATALETARTIGGVSFDGSANINLPGVNSAGTQDTSGNAGTATTLATARTIGGTSFDGSANITPANATLAASATKLATARTIGGTSFDGTANIAVALASTATTLATARTIGGVSFNGSANINLPGVNSAGNQSTSGNAATATKLATARTISLSSDVSGSASFDGSGNVTLSCTVANNSHTHTPANCGLGNLSSSGNSLSGNFTATGNITAYSDSRLKENVVTIPDALDKVKQLNGYTYTRTDGHPGSHTGVFAQDVLKVLPEAVLKGKTPEDHMSVAYGNMMGLVIEALKEMEMKIQKLEEK